MRAPATDVVGIVGREVGGVVVRRWARDARRVSWTRRKGRYLFASSVEVGGRGSGLSAISVSESLWALEEASLWARWVPFVEA